MSEQQDALFYLDLDKGAFAQGPLFENASERLNTDPTLRAGWGRYQALRALALESAPQPSERQFKEVMLACRRDAVGKRLAAAAGGDDLARELLLGRKPASQGLPAWVWALLLIGTLGLAWVAFQNQALPFLTSKKEIKPAATPAPFSLESSTSDEAMSFEFQPETAPAEVALAKPGEDIPEGEASIAGEAASARQARLLLRKHLSATASEDAGRPEPSLKTQPKKAVKPKPTLPPTLVPTAVPTAIPTKVPTLVPTAIPTLLPIAIPTLVPTAIPTLLPTVVPTSIPTAIPTLLPTVIPTSIPTAVPTLLPTVALPPPPALPTLNPTIQDPGLTLSSKQLPLTVTLHAPAAGTADLRLFDERGRSVKLVADETVTAGDKAYIVEAKDQTGLPLAKGNYYLRVMTPWFSRVEPLQVP